MKTTPVRQRSRKCKECNGLGYLPYERCESAIAGWESKAAKYNPFCDVCEGTGRI